jgi:hypothetical protein
MRTFDIRNESGELIGFEIENLFVGRSRVVKSIASISGSEILVRPRLFRRADIFCEFKLEEEYFIVEEPFGDNSRYLIAHKDGLETEQLKLVKNVFEKLRPWFSLQAVFVALFVSIILFSIFQMASNFITKGKCLNFGEIWQKKQCIHAEKNG